MVINQNRYDQFMNALALEKMVLMVSVLLDGILLGVLILDITVIPVIKKYSSLI